MRGLSPGVSILKYHKGTEGYYEFEVGIDGVKSIPFELPVPNIECLGEEACLSLIERSARTMIERYGDARDPRTEASVSELLSAVA